MPFHSQKELSGPDATRIDSDINAGTFVDATFHFTFSAALHMAEQKNTKCFASSLMFLALIAAWFLLYLIVYYLIIYVVNSF